MTLETARVVPAALRFEAAWESALSRSPEARAGALLGGSFLGVAVMGRYLLRRHLGIRDTGRPLGDEVDAPPHPRGRAV